MAAPAKGKPSSRRTPAPVTEAHRYGFGWILLTIALSTAAFAALGVLAAHL